MVCVNDNFCVLSIYIKLVHNTLLLFTYCNFFYNHQQPKYRQILKKFGVIFISASVPGNGSDAK